ncbi:MAG TPA: hypothetical protein VIY86_14930, partial [Pirellulaceae bacterium]
DFNLWNANKFTTQAAWSAGDYDASGIVDGSDYNLWNANKFTSAGRAATTFAVPLSDRSRSTVADANAVARVKRNSAVDRVFRPESLESYWIKLR